MLLELAILTFPRPDGAEQAYARLGRLAGEEAWTRELAFVERHRHDRIVVRGTIAGRYLDIETGGSVGGLVHARHGSSADGGELLEQIRVHVPEGSSAIALLAAPTQVDAMLATFAGCGGSAYRRLLLEEQVEQLRAGLTGVPAAPSAVLAPA